MAPGYFGSIWRRWRTGILATVLLHSGALLALSVTFHNAHTIAAPPSFAVEMVAAPPAAQPQPVVQKEQQSQPVRPDMPLPPIAQQRPSPNGFALPPTVPPVPQRPVSNASPTVPPAPPPAAAVAVAPVARTATSSFDPHAQVSWESDVLARLEAAKRYPASARFAHQEATILVQFEVDRSGHIIGSKLIRPSRVPDLDNEVLSLLKRVRLPPPPASTPLESLTLTVPIEFSINPN